MEECTLPNHLPFYQIHEEEGRSGEWQRSKLHVLRNENVESVLPEQLQQHSPLCSDLSTLWGWGRL